jgi:antitoxin (DNA-binding transcriptional repressor) of toxin-antitoxin stability system
MKTAAVRELRNRLSGFLRLVKSGETVLVTEHGRVIAELRRPDPEAGERDARFERFLDDLESAGRLRRATRSRSVVASLALRPDPAVPRWRDLLRATRADRGGA